MKILLIGLILLGSFSATASPENPLENQSELPLPCEVKCKISRWETEPRELAWNFIVAYKNIGDNRSHHFKSIALGSSLIPEDGLVINGTYYKDIYHTIVFASEEEAKTFYDSYNAKQTYVNPYQFNNCSIIQYHLENNKLITEEIFETNDKSVELLKPVTLRFSNGDKVFNLVNEITFSKPVAKTNAHKRLMELTNIGVCKKHFN